MTYDTGNLLLKKSYIGDYLDFMVKEDFEAAIPLKDSHFPKSFFKYRALCDYTIEMLEQRYVWLSEISQLNDPFECTIQFDNDKCLREFYSSEKFKSSFSFATGHSLSKTEIETLTTSKKPYDEYIKICSSNRIPLNQTADQQLNKVQNRWTEIVDETNRNLRICSFSLTNSSLLLWSHYSNEHKGICIEYDFQDHDPIRPFIQPVIYRDRVHKIGLFEEYTTMNMIASSLIKSKEWEYEQEWRLTIFKQKGEFPQKMNTPKPKAIFIGTRFSINKVDLKERLLKIAKANSIPVYQMTKDANEFKLVAGKSY
jgi:Protein of unknown function (DUF2971)